MAVLWPGESLRIPCSVRPASRPAEGRRLAPPSGPISSAARSLHTTAVDASGCAAPLAPGSGPLATCTARCLPACLPACLPVRTTDRSPLRCLPRLRRRFRDGVCRRLIECPVLAVSWVGPQALTVGPVYWPSVYFFPPHRDCRRAPLRRFCRGRHLPSGGRVKCPFGIDQDTSVHDAVRTPTRRRRRGVVADPSGQRICARGASRLLLLIE